MKPCIKKYDISREYFFAEGCFITELSNTPDDPGLSIARARVEPGKTTQWHCLQGVTERYVILEGIGSVEVGNLGPQVVTAGDIVIIPMVIDQLMSVPIPFHDLGAMNGASLKKY